MILSHLLLRVQISNTMLPSTSIVTQTSVKSCNGGIGSASTWSVAPAMKPVGGSCVSSSSSVMIRDVPSDLRARSSSGAGARMVPHVTPQHLNGVSKAATNNSHNDDKQNEQQRRERDTLRSAISSYAIAAQRLEPNGDERKTLTTQVTTLAHSYLDDVIHLRLPGFLPPTAPLPYLPTTISLASASAPPTPTTKASPLEISADEKRSVRDLASLFESKSSSDVGGSSGIIRVGVGAASAVTPSLGDALTRRDRHKDQIATSSSSSQSNSRGSNAAVGSLLPTTMTLPRTQMPMDDILRLFNDHVLLPGESSAGKLLLFHPLRISTM
jgi:hypothetical protein